MLLVVAGAAPSGASDASPAALLPDRIPGNERIPTLGSATPLAAGSPIASGSVAAANARAAKLKTGLYSPVYGQYIDLIHIPKTGGVSLESWAQGHGKLQWGAQMPWETLLPTYGEAVIEGGVYVSTKALRDGKMLAAAGSGKPQARVTDGEHYLPTACPAWHIPRRAYVNQAEFDPYAGKRTFCAVRHPFARAVSDFAFQQVEILQNFFPLKVREEVKNAVCTPAVLNAYLTAVTGYGAQQQQQQQAAWPALNLSVNTTLPVGKSLAAAFATALPALTKEKFCQVSNCEDPLLVSSCHMLPQWMYMRSYVNASGATVSDCDVVLREETLNADFAKMITDAGRADLLAGHPDGEYLPKDNVAGGSYCKVSVKDLTPDTVKALAAFFAEDFAVTGCTSAAHPPIHRDLPASLFHPTPPVPVPH